MFLERLRDYLRTKKTSKGGLWRLFFGVYSPLRKLSCEFLDSLAILFNNTFDNLKIEAISSIKLKEKNIKKYYYFGEFGYFNLEVLGGLSWYFKMYPHEKLFVLTYENYGKILELSFPHNLKAFYTNHPFNETYRNGHIYWDRKFRATIKKLGFKKNIALEFLSITPLLEKVRQKNVIAANFIHLTNPLKYNFDLKGQYFISIFPRFRKLDNNRNLSKENWTKILELLSQFNYKIVVHGDSSEFMKLEGNNLIYPHNVYEQIAYLNNSIICITPESGFTHFAQNCSCSVFNILMARDIASYKIYYNFNPFNTSVWISHLNEDYLSKIKKILEELNKKNSTLKFKRKKRGL